MDGFQQNAGVIVLAGDAQGFSIWAQSPQCRAEVADVPEGRVFALIDGAIVAVDSERSLAVATAEDGPGSIVWGKYAQVTNNPENDGCINAVLLV